MISRFRSVSIRLPKVESPIWLVLVLLLAIALRMARLGANSLWFDEAFSWLVARQPAWKILTQSLEPILPPLYHFLLHFWIWLGQSEAVMRSFSVVCSLLNILATYALGRELFSPATGLAAAILAATLPFHVYFAQEVRLYALVILLATLLLWTSIRAWRSTSYWAWIGFGILAAFNFYAHYFVVFTLAVLHVFAFLHPPQGDRWWRRLLLADWIALALVAPQVLTAWAQTQRVASNFWLAPPSPLEPIRTLDYLLFGHTTPSVVIPAALFLTLSIFVTVAWTAIRADKRTRRWLLLLVALVLAPMFLALVISWLTGPVYLDRSFSLVTPAYLLLLGWGIAHPPHKSPLPLLYGGLAVVAMISLGNHYTSPDPAKPPFREAGATLQENWKMGDVVFHLHDSSYLPLLYYAPDQDSYLLNNDPDTWLPPHTWDWAGRRASSVDEIVVDRSRLWLVIMPRRANDLQNEVLSEVETQYTRVGKWIWPATDSVEIHLYDLRSADLP